MLPTVSVTPCDVLLVAWMMIALPLLKRIQAVLELQSLQEIVARIRVSKALGVIGKW